MEHVLDLAISGMGPSLGKGQNIHDVRLNDTCKCILDVGGRRKRIKVLEKFLCFNHFLIRLNGFIIVYPFSPEDVEDCQNKRQNSTLYPTLTYADQKHDRGL